MTFNSMLVWLMGAGSTIAASWLLERWGWFQAQTSEKRQYIFFSVATVLGVSAWATLNYVPADVISQMTPIFAIVSAAFANIFVGTTFHSSDNAAKG